MSKYGFLDVLDQELSQNFPFDYEINWDKKNHAVEVAFLLEVENQAGIELTDKTGTQSAEDILFEEAVIFYNPVKSRFKSEDYLTAVAYEPKKGLSGEFLAYFVDFLAQTSEAGLDALIDFLADPAAQDFEIVWNEAVFEAGKGKLQETTFYPYPRY